MSVNYRDSVCYIDTNIWMYLFDKTAPAKQRISKELLLHFHRSGRDRISVQVISEWRNTMIKKYSHLVDANFRRRFLRYLGVWDPFAISPEILVKADELCDRYNFSPYDSIHVQCALELDCQYFLSEDMHDGQIIDGTLTIHNPYAGSTP